MTLTKNTFIGEYSFSLDNKGRVNIPSKFRQSLSDDNDNTFPVLSIVDTSFHENKGKNMGGAIFLSRGTLQVNRSTFTNNMAGYGGAISTGSGGLVSYSSFLKNEATECGGGIYTTRSSSIYIYNTYY